MKPLSYILCVLLLVISCKSDKGNIPTEIPQPKFKLTKETTGLTHCQSSVFDSKTNRIYTSSIGNYSKDDGTIALLDIDGSIINSKFIDSLDDPKGMAIYKNKLYIADVKRLIEADITTGAILHEYTNSNAFSLNDVVVSNTGDVYVSDTNGSRIHKLDSDKNFDVWLKDAELNYPNGLFLKDTIMYVASWGSNKNGRVSKINMRTKSIDTLTAAIGNLYGITQYTDNLLMVTEWDQGKLYLVDDYFGTIKDVFDTGRGAGSIGFVENKNLLLLPMNLQNTLMLYEVTEP